MQGFFSTEETQSSIAEEKKMPECGSCGLRKTCKAPLLQPEGKGNKGILILVEAPFKARERISYEARVFLEDAFSPLGINLEHDCWLYNSVVCTVPGSKPPTSQQVNACRPNVWKLIKKLQPQLILALGPAAITSMAGHRANLGGSRNDVETKWRGWQIPDAGSTGAWICPLQHPQSFLNDRKTQQVCSVLFKQDLESCIGLAKKKLPAKVDSSDIIIDPEEALEEAKILLEFLDKQEVIVAVDFETNCLKPHSDKSDLVSASFCYNTGKRLVTFALMWEKDKLYTEKIINHRNCMKIAANLLMEVEWSREFLGHTPAGWIWDTVLAAHVLDHRPGICSVKFQAFVRLGVEEYNSHIHNMIISDSSYVPNRIRQIDEKDLLIYNGMDSKVEYLLAFQQMKDMGITPQEAIHEFN